MKLLKIFGISLGVLFLLLLIAPFLFKGKIVAAVKSATNEQLNATLSFNENIGLSLISSFPNLSLTIKDITLVNKAPFVGDTLFSTKEFNAVLDIMSVINGEQINIRKVFLVQPKIYAAILPDGSANWDIALADSAAPETLEDTASSAFSLKLRSLEIKEGQLIYDDKQGKMKASLYNLNYKLSGDFSETLMSMLSALTIEAFTYEMDGVTYLNKVKAAMDGTIEANLNQMQFAFKENTFKLNALEMLLDGSLAMPGDDMVMDLKWGVKQNDIAQFLSLIPAIYSSDMKDLQSKGKLTLNGFIKGTYNETVMPGFGLNLCIDEGWFRYTALPYPLEALNVKLSINNPDGVPDHTEINLEKLHWLLQGDAFNAKLIAKTPESDPYVDAVFAGKINLGNIANLIPLPAGTKLQGVLTSDFAAKGNMSTLDKGNYEAFEAKGSLQITKLLYATTDLPKPFKINEASMNFTPKQVLLNNFDAAIGNSDFKLKGALENFYGYYLGNATLKGNLNLLSNLLDANEWLSEEPEAAAVDTAAMSIVLLPEKIDFQFTSSIQKLLYTNMEITNFKGGIHLANQKLDLQKIALDLLGSNMKLDGFYETKNPMVPTTKIDFSIQNLDVQEAYKTFNTVKKLAPAAENISGKISTVFTMYTALTSTMQPDLNSLIAEGYLSIPQASIGNIKALNKIADVLAKPDYKQLTVSNAKIKWKVINGRVYTEPFNVKMGAQNMTLSGSTGLDQTIAYNGLINIPRKDLGAADAAINSAINQFNSALGSDLKLNEIIPLVLNIGGTFTKPEIKTNLKDLLSNQAGTLKDKALDEAKKKAKELEAKAREDVEKLRKDAEDKAKAEAQKLKAEAESKVNAEKEKLKKEAEAKRKEAEAKAKAEADKAKKQLEEEAKKKLKGLLKP